MTIAGSPHGLVPNRRSWLVGFSPIGVRNRTFADPNVPVRRNPRRPKRGRTRWPTVLVMPVDPEIQAMLDALAALNAPSMTQGSPEQARQAFRFMTVDLRRPESVVPVKETEDVVIAADVGDLAARI